MLRSSVAPTRFVSDLVVDELVGRARIALPISVASGTVPTRGYAIALWLLFFLFAVRVVAQPLALVVHSAILPPFESWHSAALPYGVLVASQIAILLALGLMARRFTAGTVTPRRPIGALALVFGALYLVSMVVRLALGLTVLGHVRWFASPLPTVFHIVLATSLLLFGQFHYVHGRPASSDR
jgi:hypothetical protein